MSLATVRELKSILLSALLVELMEITLGCPWMENEPDEGLGSIKINLLSTES